MDCFGRTLIRRCASKGWIRYFVFALTGISSISFAQIVTTNASDNAGNYSGVWTNGANGGTGFGAWALTTNTSSGGWAGTFIGDPNYAGITNFGNNAFGLYAKPDNSNRVSAIRSLSRPMAVGETLRFEWAVNYDSGGYGYKGFDIYSGGTNGTRLLNVNQAGFPGDLYFESTNGSTSTKISFSYGTSPMTWKFELINSNTLRVTGTPRNTATNDINFTTNLVVTAAPDAFKFYASGLSDISSDLRQPYFNNFALTAIPPADFSYTPLSVSGTVGVAIDSLTPTVTGIVESYSVSPDLPSGLEINTSTGVISGTPTAVAGSGLYTVTAMNAGGSTTATVTLVVNPVPPSDLSYTPSTLTASVGTPISKLTPAVQGLVESYSVSPALPQGLELNTLTGEISGTPTEVAVSDSYTVTARNAGGTTTTTLTVMVMAAVPADSSFAGWLSNNVTSADLLKLYAFGAPSPTGSVSRSYLPSGSISNSNLVLTYFVRRQATNTNLVTPQWHTNLMLSNSWTPVDGANIATVGTNTNADGVAVIQKTATVPVDSNSRKFLRLKISE